ncbi:hypothetical protein GCM10020229_52250 [Kitasatospora albolonga]|uniref:hypothetical protein n=1 Tax=Kitasatospora albolonga TaxID=68173 RepID=UPI0031E75C0B
MTAPTLAPATLDGGNLAPSTPGGETFAPAFGGIATVRPLDLGPGLAGQIRTSPAGTVHVLTVHNTSDQPQTLYPEDLLPHGDEPLMFLGGRSTSSEQDGRIVARLDPHTHVHLGRITAPENA